MKRLALLPLVMLVFACNDSTLVQPENDLTIAAAARAARTTYDFRLLETDDNDWGESRETPSGVLHMWGFDFGYDVEGDLEGYQNLVGGRCQINQNNGKGTCIAKALFDLTEPGVGTFDCLYQGSVENFPDHIQIGRIYSCKGTGYFAGKKMKGTVDNEANPGVGDFDATVEIW